MAEPEKEPEAKATWVCIGMRLNTEDKLIQCFYTLLPDDKVDTNQMHAFKGVIAKHAPAGGIYDVTTTKAGASVFTKGEKGPKFRRMLRDSELLTEWEAADQVAKASAAAERAAHKALNQPSNVALLVPFMRAMAKTDRAGRHAIIAWITETLLTTYTEYR